MKKTALFLLFTVIATYVFPIPCVFGDRSWYIRSPRGSRVQLVLTDVALREFRIHDLRFSDDGNTFCVTVERFRRSDTTRNLVVRFYENEYVAQEDYVDIGPQRTVREVYCPERYDRVIIDESAY